MVDGEGYDADAGVVEFPLELCADGVDESAFQVPVAVP